MKKLIFASNNLHKLEEVRRILFPLTIHSLKEVGFLFEIEESGKTLEENSRIKARAVAEWLQAQGRQNEFLIFADDTGLEIEALAGKPGVYTARWAGEPACDTNNRKKALEELNGITNRHARFCTIITLIDGDKEIQLCGEVKGTIANEEKGNGGFGYDPLFIPEGYNQTFAQLPQELKNSISHRARALEKLAQVLEIK